MRLVAGPPSIPYVYEVGTDIPTPIYDSVVADLGFDPEASHIDPFDEWSEW